MHGALPFFLALLAGPQSPRAQSPRSVTAEMIRAITNQRHPLSAQVKPAKSSEPKKTAPLKKSS